MPLVALGRQSAMDGQETSFASTDDKGEVGAEPSFARECGIELWNRTRGMAHYCYFLCNEAMPKVEHVHAAFVGLNDRALGVYEEDTVADLIHLFIIGPWNGRKETALWIAVVPHLRAFNDCEERGACGSKIWRRNLC